jgi:transcription antitermination factor NusG
MKLFKSIKYYLFAFLILCSEVVIAQELNCNVQISAQKIQGSNRQVFESMQRDIYEFMNNTIWTNHVFSYAERIDCNILINLTEQLSADEFRGTIQVQLRRPVFNTTYNSTMLNFVDNNFQFRYVEFQPLEFDPNSYRSSLVSVLAYYSYIIIGFDYDSYSPEGGTEFFQIAEKIVTNAQNASEAGWKPYDGSRNKNRYWLVKNLLDDGYTSVRRFIYEYDRIGLDKMESSIAEARTNMVESLKLLQEVYRNKPDPYMYLVQIILESKSDELVNIFSGAFAEEKGRVVEILTEIDPGNKAKYQKITAAN